jgi:hypothetical protein
VKAHIIVGLLLLPVGCGTEGQNETAATLPDVPGVACVDVAVPASIPAAYTHACNARGVLIVSTDAVAPAARYRTAEVLRAMTRERPALLPALADAHARFTVLSEMEQTASWPDLSERSADVIDRRGMGPSERLPSTLVPEEDVMCYPNRAYGSRATTIHEIGHALHALAMAKLDPGFDQRLRMAFIGARESGLWENTYSAKNHAEYFARGMEAWFDADGAAASENRSNADVRTRSELEAYDPRLAGLVRDVVGDPVPPGPCIDVPAPLARACTAADPPPTMSIPASLLPRPGTVRGTIWLREAMPADATLFLRAVLGGSASALVLKLPATEELTIAYAVTGLPPGNYAFAVEMRRAGVVERVGASGGAMRSDHVVSSNFFRIDENGRCGVDITLASL